MKIAIIAGGNRKEASSTQLLRYMEKSLQEKEISVTFIDLYQHQLPLYSPDSSEPSEQVDALIQAVSAADGVILGTPEYHGSFSGVLKNALDYLGAAQFEGKPVLVASAAAGAVGVSSLTQLQTIVRNLHGINCTEWVSIGGDNRQFGEDGEPANDKVKQRVLYALAHLTRLVKQLRLSEE
ncbi:NAD(P)H-dependent oxidoreductase [Paenibacillus pasadenensis]|uniref:NADPH-dependent FMN reductase n=1 Tax=Paenibacillus pasadenensis TaxID=217090 RepID=UPI00204198F7|nr:NADPH-dependent FMN reductase [Paenibacillus pasadenensis]MCM3748377.1 NAD(P)H-dependent oxidoreductase [Paenibacillus pasadenensis]